MKIHTSNFLGTFFTFVCLAITSNEAIAQPCNLGKYSATGNAPCTDCAAGTFANTPGSTSCTPCDAGTFQSNPAGTTCALCSPGKYSGSGASECADCAAGTFNTSLGSATCTDCPIGSTSIGGSTSCATCNPGTYAQSAGSPSCSDCAPGTFTADQGSSTCANCAAGTFTASGASSACQNCPGGTFQANLGSSTCDSCSGRNFTFDAGASACLTCSSFDTPLDLVFSGIKSSDDGRIGSLKINALRTVSKSLYSSFAPENDGMSIVIENRSGDRIVDADLAGGLRTDLDGPGWRKVTSRGVALWTYRDSAGSIEGIKRVDIQATKTNKGKSYQLSLDVRSTSADFEIAKADSPLKLVIGFGSSRSTPCIIKQFASKSCSFSDGNQKLQCSVE